jgi:hypothetical protein
MLFYLEISSDVLSWIIPLLCRTLSQISHGKSISLLCSASHGEVLCQMSHDEVLCQTSHGEVLCQASYGEVFVSDVSRWGFVSGVSRWGFVSDVSRWGFLSGVSQWVFSQFCWTPTLNNKWWGADVLQLLVMIPEVLNKNLYLVSRHFPTLFSVTFLNVQILYCSDCS